MENKLPTGDNPMPALSEFTVTEGNTPKQEEMLITPANLGELIISTAESRQAAKEQRFLNPIPRTWVNSARPFEEGPTEAGLNMLNHLRDQGGIGHLASEQAKLPAEQRDYLNVWTGAPKGMFHDERLQNQALAGVDPFSNDLTADQRLAIMRECHVNPVYFTRIVLRDYAAPPASIKDYVDNALAGAEQNSDKGYEVSTHAAQAEFQSRRDQHLNTNLPGPIDDARVSDKAKPTPQSVVAEAVARHSAHPRGNFQDIDTAIFAAPVRRGYTEGIKRLQEQLLDTREAAKGLLGAVTPLPEPASDDNRADLVLEPTHAFKMIAHTNREVLIYQHCGLIRPAGVDLEDMLKARQTTMTVFTDGQGSQANVVERDLEGVELTSEAAKLLTMFLGQGVNGQLDVKPDSYIKSWMELSRPSGYRMDMATASKLTFTKLDDKAYEVKLNPVAKAMLEETFGGDALPGMIILDEADRTYPVAEVNIPQDTVGKLPE